MSLSDHDFKRLEDSVELGVLRAMAKHAEEHKTLNENIGKVKGDIRFLKGIGVGVSALLTGAVTYIGIRK